MVCRNCGQNVNEDMNVCPQCGNPITKKKSYKKLLILGILALVIGLLIFILYNWFKEKNNKQYGYDTSIKDVTYVYGNNGIPKFITGSFTDKKVNNKEDALMALDEIKDLLKMNDPTKELELDYEENSNDVTFYRFNQMYNNIPVLNQNVIVAVDKDNNVLSYSGYYIPNINIDTNPKLTKENIQDIFINDMGNETKVLNNSLYVYDDNSQEYLVYVINGYSNTKLMEYIIDANTGDILTKSDLFEYAGNYLYTGEGLDNKTYSINLEEYFELMPPKNRYKFHDIQRKISVSDYRFMGPYVSTLLSLMPGSTSIVVDIKNGKIDMTWENETFIKSAISTMANYETIYDYYKDVLGRNSYDNKGSKIILNLGVTASTFSNESLNNASWSRVNDQMFIGDYNGKSFSASLDVLGHEFTHGVIEYTSKFASSPKKSDRNKAFETGALNEGYADILGSIIEGQNWTMGENNEILRSAINPNFFQSASVKGEKYYYPDSYLQGHTIEEFLEHYDFEYASDYDSGGVHQNSSVVYHAAYLMDEAGAFKDLNEMAKIWYNSLFYLSSYANFEDCAISVINSAKAFGLSDASIYKITQAFIDTKMLDEKVYNVKGTIKSGNELLEDVNIEVYSYNDKSLIEKITSDKKGNYNLELQTGMYEIQFKKEGFEDVKAFVVVNGDKNINIVLKSIPKKPVKQNGTVLENLCKDDNCYNFTIYYLESKDNKLVESHQTYAVEAGTTFDIKSVLNTLNKMIGNELITTDGKSFYISIGELKIECGWYYKGTDNKFDWTKPINEDTQVEMKLFNGTLENNDFTNIFDLFKK